MFSLTNLFQTQNFSIDIVFHNIWMFLSNVTKSTAADSSPRKRCLQRSFLCETNWQTMFRKNNFAIWIRPTKENPRYTIYIFLFVFIIFFEFEKTFIFLIQRKINMILLLYAHTNARIVMVWWLVVQKNWRLWIIIFKFTYVIRVKLL